MDGILKDVKDIDGKPIQSGFYRKRKSLYYSRRVFFINLEEDYFEIINWSLPRTITKAKISKQTPHYFSNLYPVYVNIYINHYQKKADFFKSKLEQLAQSKAHPFGEWGKEPLKFP